MEYIIYSRCIGGHWRAKVVPHNVNTLRVITNDVSESVYTSCIGKGINNSYFPIGIYKEVLNEVVPSKATPTSY
jgi:hypothetical protein